MKNIKYLFFIIFAVLSCSAQSGNEIELNNAWIREVPPGSEITALYLEIKNNGPEDQIVSVSSPVSEIAEIHNTVVSEDGTGKMMKLDNITIQKGEQISFTPGGKHIMLIDLNKQPKAGESYDITFEFKNAGKKTINATVKGLNGENHSGHSGHSMDH